jgi:hypothetical protein
MDSGIGSGFGLAHTEPVGDASAGQNQPSPRARELSKDRKDRRRRKYPEKISANLSGEEASRSDLEEVGGEDFQERASDGNKGKESGGGSGSENENENEDKRPPHRVDSLA